MALYKGELDGFRLPSPLVSVSSLSLPFDFEFELSPPISKLTLTLLRFLRLFLLVMFEKRHGLPVTRSSSRQLSPLHRVLSSQTDRFTLP